MKNIFAALFILVVLMGCGEIITKPDPDTSCRGRCVVPEAPTIENNVILIPTVEGVSYWQRNNGKNTLHREPFRVFPEITFLIEAEPLPGYSFSEGIETRWEFEYTHEWLYTESCSDMPERAELENIEAHPFEIELACLIKNHPEQRRETLAYHPILGEVARMRARGMAEEGVYHDHIDNEGRGPDWYLCEAGYEIDVGYCLYIRENPAINGVEIITVGPGSSVSTAEQAIESWYQSRGHRNAMLALEHEVFKEEVYFGMGYGFAEEFPEWDNPQISGVYWVYIMARPPISEVSE